LILVQDKKLEPENTVIEAELDTLFGRNGCDLPVKLQKKINKENRKGVIPKELRDVLGDGIKATALKVSGLSAQASLHVIQATEGTNSALLRLVGTDSYSSTPATSLVDGQASNIAYTMDCSGYLNAAVSAEGAIPTSVAKAAAEAALQSKNSLIVIRAAVFSPVALAMNPSLGAIKLTPVKRLDILYAMVVEAKSQFPAATDAMMLKSWRQLNLLWTSNQGSSSLQGKTSISANASIGAGPVTFSSAVDGGATMSKGISFTSFNTYIIDEALTGPVELALGTVRSMVGDLVAQASPSSPASRVSNYYVTTYPTIPQNICALYWTVAPADGVGNHVSSGTVSSSWEEGICKVKYEPKQIGAGGLTLTAVAKSGLDAQQEFNLTYPIAKE
jgi:hypothetical protein